MDLTTMTLDQLNALFAEKHAAFKAIEAKTDRTAGDVTQARELASELTELQTAIDGLNSFDSLAESFAPKKADEEPAADEVDEADKAVEDDAAGDTVKGGSGNAAPEPTVVQEQQVDVPAVGEVAGGEGGVPLQTRSAVEALAAKRGAGDKPEVPTYRRRGGAHIKATPDLQHLGIGAGARISMAQTAEAVLDRLGTFPAFQEGAVSKAMLEAAAADPMKFIHKAATAAFAYDVPDELMVNPDTMGPADIEEIINRAVDESTLTGGSLVAAGGWCAPSEQVYDLSMDASTDGMLSLPEIGVRRGGLKWPISPDFSDFYANPGFRQTEAEAIAGTSKTCVEIDCPSFDEKRMSVEGLCIKVPILTEVGFPEYVKNFVDGTLVAHQHWMNAHYISELVTIAGSAKTLAGLSLGSTVVDMLNAFDVMAERIRQKYRLPFNTTIEAVLPHWVLSAMRADISSRSALAIPTGVADSVLNKLFSERRINPQYVYDWQELALTDTGGTAGINEAVSYPATFDALMYPAGTVFKGAQPVINLSTVYDAASLQVNTYTGLFTEQGYMIGKRKFHIERLTVPVCNAGRTGASDFTCA